ncbi:hypothetical protein HRI_005107000 [Hibiscus trionum]|uniref:Uncharacterized protein n=1 Tax=Hibiscus trionum TaxID=183268 RepID=A0A9W7MQS6_HIBTR|nr:hypothetical protein HRI_005107000 [Hibiscus trionum]
MVMKQFLLAFAAAVLWSSVESAQSPDFAYYNLSLIWPASFCFSAPKNCIRPIPKIFTINNGLCPTLKNGTALPPYDPVDNNCNYNPAAPADIMKSLAPIKTRLQKTWSNLLNGGSNDLFWQIEWTDQGMCSDYPQDPLTYFTTNLNLAENSKYDPLKALGVQPSSTSAYAISTLLANVKKKVGFYPQISCIIQGSNKLYLREVRFCFKRAKPPTQLQDCPSQMDYVCKSVPTVQQKVIFPPPPATVSSHDASREILASTPNEPNETPTDQGGDIMSPPATASSSSTSYWPNLTCGSLVYIQWGIISLLVLYILARRNRAHEHVD